MQQKAINITADFSGGLDLVFNGQAQIRLSLPQNSKVSDVIVQLQKKYANEKKICFQFKAKCNLLFYQSRNGILVLVNQADWELVQKQNTLLQNKDKVSFISTLHGG